MQRQKKKFEEQKDIFSISIWFLSTIFLLIEKFEFFSLVKDEFLIQTQIHQDFLFSFVFFPF